MTESRQALGLEKLGLIVEQLILNSLTLLKKKRVPVMVRNDPDSFAFLCVYAVIRVPVITMMLICAAVKEFYKASVLLHCAVANIAVLIERFRVIYFTARRLCPWGYSEFDCSTFVLVWARYLLETSRSSSQSKLLCDSAIPM